MGGLTLESGPRTTGVDVEVNPSSTSLDRTTPDRRVVGPDESPPHQPTPDLGSLHHTPILVRPTSGSMEEDRSPGRDPGPSL